MISLYRPGNSPLHRMSAGLKLLGLIVVLISISIWGRTPTSCALVIAGLLALFALARFGIVEVIKQVWNIKLVLVLVAVPQIIFSGIAQGSYNSVAIVASILLAGLVTLTTKTSELVALVERITKSRPLAFLLALSINSITLVTGFSKNITEAGMARGVKRNPIGQIVTLFVVSLRFADDYAEAMAARGVSV